MLDVTYKICYFCIVFILIYLEVTHIVQKNNSRPLSSHLSHKSNHDMLPHLTECTTAEDTETQKINLFCFAHASAPLPNVI